MKLLLAFIVVSMGYIFLYGGYTYTAKTMAGRIVYISAMLAGTLIGSTLGNRWFK